MKFKIEYVKRKIKPGNWIGMNKFAAMSHNIPFHHKSRKTIEIYKTSKPIMHATEKHEEIEYLLMRRGLNYHKAHNIALRYEDKPQRVSNILKRINKRRC